MKRFLMVVGAISMMGFLPLVAGLGFIGSQAISSAEQNKKTAVQAIREISQNWSLDGRGKIVAPSLVRIARSPQGSRAFKIFSRLGSLMHADRISQTHFGISSTSGTTATVEFIGTFTHGTAKLTVKLRKQDDVMKVLGFKTTETQLRRSRPAVSA